jgi:hypothetical protein
VFLPVFWTIYIPIVTIMLAAAGEWLIRALHQLRAQARLASSNRRRVQSCNRWSWLGGGDAQIVCRPSTRSRKGFAASSHNHARQSV